MRFVLLTILIVLTGTGVATSGAAASFEGVETVTFVLTNDTGASAPPLTEDPVPGYFTELVRLGGNGFRHTERAAFLVLDESDGIRCLLWPKNMGFRKESFHGVIPKRTIAIVHTHPKDQPVPSAGDRREAMRLGIPFIVVSPRDIYAVSADGDVIPIEKNRPWRYRVVESKLACETLND